MDKPMAYLTFGERGKPIVTAADFGGDTEHMHRTAAVNAWVGLFPAVDRAHFTSRRIAAVEHMISEGYTWNGRAWVFE